MGSLPLSQPGNAINPARNPIGSPNHDKRRVTRPGHARKEEWKSTGRAKSFRSRGESSGHVNPRSF